MSYKPTHIDMTPELLEKFKAAYDKAIRDGKKKTDVLVVEGYELVVGYLKYVIEYADTLMGGKAPPRPGTRPPFG
jgi:hypothetical protein